MSDSHEDENKSTKETLDEKVDTKTKEIIDIPDFAKFNDSPNIIEEESVVTRQQQEGNNTVFKTEYPLNTFEKTEPSSQSFVKTENSTDYFIKAEQNSGIFGKGEAFSNPFSKTRNNTDLFVSKTHNPELFDKTEPSNKSFINTENNKDTYTSPGQNSGYFDKTEAFNNPFVRTDHKSNPFIVSEKNIEMSEKTQPCNNPFVKTEINTDAIIPNEQKSDFVDRNSSFDKNDISNPFIATGKSTGILGKTSVFTNTFGKAQENTDSFPKIGQKNNMFNKTETLNNFVGKTEQSSNISDKSKLSGNSFNPTNTFNSKTYLEENIYPEDISVFKPKTTAWDAQSNNSSFFGDNKSISPTFNNSSEDQINFKEKPGIQETEIPKTLKKTNSNPFAFMKEIEDKQTTKSDFATFLDRMAGKQKTVSIYGDKNETNSIVYKDATDMHTKSLTSIKNSNTSLKDTLKETTSEPGQFSLFNINKQNFSNSTNKPITKLFNETNEPIEFKNYSMEAKPDNLSNQNTAAFEPQKDKGKRTSMFGETNPIFDKKYDSIFETETSKPKMEIKEISENYTTAVTKEEKETINKEVIKEKKNIMEYLLIDFNDKEVINLIRGIISYFNTEINILETGDIKQLMFYINKCKVEGDFSTHSEIEIEEEIKAMFNSNSSFIFESERLKNLFIYQKENKSLLLEVISFVIERFDEIEPVFKDFYSYVFSIYLIKVLNSEITRKLSKTQITNILNTLVLLPVPYSVLNSRFFKDISNTENTINILKYLNEKTKKNNKEYKQVKKLFNNYNSIYKNSVYAFNNIYNMNNNKRTNTKFRFAKIDEQIMIYYFSILGNLDHSIEYEDREIFLSVLKTCDLASLLKKHVIYCLNIDTHDFPQIEMLIKKDELLKNSKKIAKFYVKLIEELELKTFDLNLFNPNIFSDECLLIILKKTNINKLLEHNYSTALVNTMNDLIYENIYLNIKENGLSNFQTSLFIKLLGFKHLKFFKILELLNQEISISYILMNRELFSEQMFFNKEGFITYIEFLSLDMNIKRSKDKNKNVPTSKNYKGATLLSKLMFGLIIEINEFIRKEQWECSKYLEQIGALIEVINPTILNDINKEEDKRKKLKLTDKFYCLESNLDSFYNLITSRNLYHKKFISVKEIFKSTDAFKNYQTTKYLFSSQSKLEVLEDKEKYKNDRKIQMVINLFTDQPIVPNNQLFIKTFKEETDPLIKYYSLKLIERKKDTKVLHLLNAELKNLIDCKGDCTKIVSDYYVKGIIVSILKCIDADEIHLCDCIGFKDIKELIQRKREAKSLISVTF